jgi:hypothetical protein
MRCLTLAIPVLLAHSWYEPECCSGQDCDPLTRESSVISVRGGYQVTVRPGAPTVFFSQDKVRPSRDGLYHACISLSAGTPICLYVPYGA